MYWVEDPGAAGTLPRFTDDSNIDHRIHTDIEMPLGQGVGIFTSTLAANTDNLGIGRVTVVRILGNNFNLTGMVPSYDGQTVLLLNADGADNLTLVHDATSTAANRFVLPGLANLVMPPRSMVLAWYDTTATRWFVTGPT
jgi:hypothetical protein